MKTKSFLTKFLTPDLLKKFGNLKNFFFLETPKTVLIQVRNNISGSLVNFRLI